MAGTALIAMEGVLSTPHGQPIREGVALYHSLKTTYKLVLACDELAEHQAEHWLQLEGLRDHVKLMTAEVAIGGNDVRYEQLRVLGGIQMRPTIVVDPSPARCATAVANGDTTLMFCQPSYARPEWRADDRQGVRAWSEIAEEMDQQAAKRSRDERVDAEMTTD
jgi:hypothetical protein